MVTFLFVLCSVALFPYATHAGYYQGMESHPDTTPYCTWWYDNYKGISCTQIASEFVITPADIARWNPSVTATCGNWLDGFSYCVEAMGEPLSSTTSSTTTTTSRITTSSRSIVTSIPTWTAKGCYNDYTPPTIENSITIGTGNGLMTIESCQIACWAGGWIFAGVELKTQCFCGNYIGNEIALDGNCKMPCPGNTAQLCGGQNRIFVYKGTVASTTTTGTSTTSTKTSSVSAVPTSKETWKSLGCYFDTGTPHSLLNRTITPPETQMTVTGCQASCNINNFLYAGLRYGKSCFCDNTIKTVPSNDLLCNIPCTGNTAQMCGGTDRISIYQHAVLTTQYINLGCYVDAGTGSRTLRTFTYVYGGDDATSVTTCAQMCGSKGFDFSGTENGVECWCDTAIQKVAVLAPEGIAGCTTPCRGNTTQICGGTKRMSIAYRVPL